MTTYEISSDLSEKQIEADVAEYLGFISPSWADRFKLLDVDERLTGADKKLNWRGIACYFQFKKATGLKSGRPDKIRKNESALQSIRRFRHDTKLTSSPHSLCFGLRAPQRDNAILQHNALLSYNKPPLSHAIYVCPLSLRRSEYDRLLEPPQHEVDPFIYWRHNWVLHGQWVVHSVHSSPFLRAHVSIAPTELVKTHEHYYSFSTAGDQIVFHSPVVLPDAAVRLSDFLSRRYRHLLLSSGDTRPPPLRELVAGLAKSAAEAGYDGVTDSEADPVEWLVKHGVWLQGHHDIRQIVLLVRDEPPEG